MQQCGMSGGLSKHGSPSLLRFSLLLVRREQTDMLVQSHKRATPPLCNPASRSADFDLSAGGVLDRVPHGRQLVADRVGLLEVLGGAGVAALFE